MNRCCRAAEFTDTLAAAATGRHQTRPIANHQNFGNLVLTAHEHGGNGAGFSAGALRIGSIFNIASGINRAGRRTNGRPDLKM